MTAKKVNAAEIAHRLDVDPGTVSRWLSKEDVVMEAQHLLALARVLDTDPFALFDGSFKEPLPARENVRPGRRTKAELALAAAAQPPPQAAPRAKAPRVAVGAPPKKTRPQAE